MNKISVSFLVIFSFLVPSFVECQVTRYNEDTSRIECLPFKNLSEGNCSAAGCIWKPSKGAPSCFLPDSDHYGYEINSQVRQLDDNRGFQVELRRLRLGSSSKPPSLYGADIDHVTFQVDYYSPTQLAFAIYPKGSERLEKRPPVEINERYAAIDKKLYSVELADTAIGRPFNFRVIRQETETIIFDTSMGGLTIAEQFLMISTKLPTHYLYGLGENNHDTFLHNMSYKTWPIFARDQPPDYDDFNLYGAHPFYMASENDGSSHGVFLFNSHAIDVTTMPNPGLTFRTIGGMLEFFIFLGPTPENVVQQYTDVIGRTFLPPYWSLGFQISRWGYHNTDDITAVLDRTKKANIPQDVQYADIDYMDGKRDFTIDPVNFAGLPKLVEGIKAEGVRFVVILDPTIAVDYDVFDRANASQSFIQWANSSGEIAGQDPYDPNVYGNVWPEGPVAFIDFFKTSAREWWAKEIGDFHSKLQFDGLWIDMNEVSNFDTNRWPDKLQCPVNKWDDPPYETMAAHTGIVQRISDKTICMTTTQGDSNQYLQYEVHNLFGYSQAIATQRAARQATGKRSMVLSRSTFPGSGKYTGHWLGDNFARWSNMGDSIIGMFEFNMFGIPYNGADICGFNEETTEELCRRWIQLGAFYPFSRSHNTLGDPDQDPAAWPSVASAASKALMIRYRLLPYLYTLFHDSHSTGSTVVRPLYHEYAKDLRARSVDKQFLWGQAFMISPVLEEKKTTVQVYFPDDVWYDYYTGARMASTGELTLQAAVDHINLHIRGGFILPAQKPALNTMLSRQNHFELIVALKDNYASGKMIWDDGESDNTIQDGLYTTNLFQFHDNKLSITAHSASASAQWEGIQPALHLIQIMGLHSSPKSIAVNGTEIDDGAFRFDSVNNVLTIEYPFNLNYDSTISLGQHDYCRVSQ